MTDEIAKIVGTTVTLGVGLLGLKMINKLEEDFEGKLKHTKRKKLATPLADTEPKLK